MTSAISSVLGPRHFEHHPPLAEFARARVDVSHAARREQAFYAKPSRNQLPSAQRRPTASPDRLVWRRGARVLDAVPLHCSGGVHAARQSKGCARALRHGASLGNRGSRGSIAVLCHKCPSSPAEGFSTCASRASRALIAKRVHTPEGSEFGFDGTDPEARRGVVAAFDIPRHENCTHHRRCEENRHVIIQANSTVRAGVVERPAHDRLGGVSPGAAA
jgi:hypothetical protein